MLKNSVLNDILEAIRLYPICNYMAYKEIVGRYKRTFLGPLWITLGTGISVVSMGIVWSFIFHMDVNNFFPYLASGLIIWTLISAIIMESPEIFATKSTMLKNLKLPVTSYVLTLIAKNFFIFCHNFLIFILVALVFSSGISAITFLAIPGMFFLLVSFVPLVIILGIFGSRYRDVTPIIGSLMTILFLLTPIMWDPTILTGKRAYIATFNPLTHYLNIIRAPLLNKIPPYESYVIAIGITVFLFTIAFFLLKKYRTRIVFWV